MLSSKRVFLTPAQENTHSNRDYRASLFHCIRSIEEIPSHPLLVLDAYISWDPKMLEFPGDVVIKGYFQYLPTIQPAISLITQDLIQYLTPNREFLRKKYSLLNLSCLGFMHVRRGDYLAKPDIHYIQSETYYEEGLKYTPNVSRWFVLSDDIEYCKVNPFFEGCEFLEEPDELMGLAFMSLCHGGAIIGNSTYSWWGAILGPHQSKAPVIYPSKWSQNASPVLFPDSWIRLGRTSL
jgi:hypothetical protein